MLLKDQVVFIFLNVIMLLWFFKKCPYHLELHIKLQQEYEIKVNNIGHALIITEVE